MGFGLGPQEAGSGTVKPMTQTAPRSRAEHIAYDSNNDALQNIAEVASRPLTVHYHSLSDRLIQQVCQPLVHEQRTIPRGDICLGQATTLENWNTHGFDIVR